MGCIAFSPLAQGLLTDKYLKGVPADSRAASGSPSWQPDFLNAGTLNGVRALAGIAKKRGQTLAQMAVAWVLRDPRMTSALIGASRVEQVREIVGALKNAQLQSGRIEGDRQGGGRRRREHLEEVERVLNRQGARSDHAGLVGEVKHSQGSPSQIIASATQAIRARPR